MLPLTLRTPLQNLSYMSGMLQSWNQLCFTGGIIEVSINLPGRPDVTGLWPGALVLSGFPLTNETDFLTPVLLRCMDDGQSGPR
jgi:beta-glucanase (GH16 family)